MKNRLARFLAAFTCLSTILIPSPLSAQPAQRPLAPPRVTNPEPALPIPPGPFAPTWESLEKNWRVPAWFLDGKFGIFLHWGPYSVAARQSEWYPRHIYATRSVTEWHALQFGEGKGYKDIIPLFRAEKFDAARWAELFRKSGAKYVMPVAEHHDGFAMWDSALTKWDAKEMAPSATSSANSPPPAAARACATASPTTAWSTGRSCSPPPASKKTSSIPPTPISTARLNRPRAAASSKAKPRS